MWGTVLKRDLLGETREEDKFYTKEKLREYLKSEIEKQGENVSIRNLDVSLIEDMSWLFHDITNGVRTLDLSGWDTSNVKNMSHVFSFCDKLESLDLSGWNTSNVEDMTTMFFSCTNIESLDLSSWDVSKVKDMNYMFYYCSDLITLDLSGWNTSNVEDMSYMFYECPAPYKVVGNKIVKK